MAGLRDRLKRINEAGKKVNPPKNFDDSNEITDLIANGFTPSGYKVYKKNVILETSLKLSQKLPNALKILIPDLANDELPEISDLVFFDLETTGLSGGAGTVAFLAAFGGFITAKNAAERYKDEFLKLKEKENKACKNYYLRVTQYLLLDYPGENDFILNALLELGNKSSVIISYNGKCFDSQIIKTRCLMNRIKPPVYRHADLLHPARRLWKNIINDCSQASIEWRILNIKRKDDIPGSLAPVIWFDFLKTGNTKTLIQISDHNIYDISGLASILRAMITIAESPLDPGKTRYDIEKLALYWRKYSRYQNKENKTDNELIKTGKKILQLAAERNHPRAVYIFAFDLIKTGDYEEAYRYVKKGLTLYDKESKWHKKLLRRKERLEKKLKR
ncbi:MAG: ribonuclease H-like domain-containing protein [Treponema sp.]|nr:ribonuclease H-like domain-containing protein [Treponema sp.]